MIIKIISLLQKWYNSIFINKKIIDINSKEFVEKYIEHIICMNTLDKEMIYDISYMSTDNKMTIITTLNDVIESLKVFI
jgi:hypothetical protein